MPFSISMRLTGYSYSDSERRSSFGMPISLSVLAALVSRMWKRCSESESSASAISNAECFSSMDFTQSGCQYHWLLVDTLRENQKPPFEINVLLQSVRIGLSRRMVLTGDRVSTTRLWISHTLRWVSPIKTTFRVLSNSRTNIIVWLEYTRNDRMQDASTIDDTFTSDLIRRKSRS